MSILEDNVLNFKIQLKLREKLLFKVTRFDCTGQRLITSVIRIEELV